LEAGADQVNVFEPPFPKVRERFRGAVGTVNAEATVAVLEENADVEPLGLVAVTRQRIGLWYPKAKKLEGGV
jgi:hypothetical protein